MIWHTGKYLNNDDIMRGLPKPWRDIPGVKVTLSATCITASIPLSHDIAQRLVGQSGIYREDGTYHEDTAEEIAQKSRLNIGAVDKMTGEWVMNMAPDGSRDKSTPIVEFRI